MRIVITGDLLRQTPQWSNIATLHHLISRQIKNLTGVTPELCNYQEPISPSEYLESQNETSFKISPSPIFKYGDPTSTFWITFEGNRRFIHQLQELGCNYIDIHIHPYRFTEDLIFGVTSSVDLTNHELPRYYFEQQSQLIKAGMEHLPFIDIDQNSLLLVGQTNFDTSVIHNGKYSNLTDFKQQIINGSEGFDEIIYKPHPFNLDNNLNLMLELFHGKKKYHILQNEVNAYKLLSEPSIKKVIGISSSLIMEAELFDKETKSFIPIKARDTIPIHPQKMMSYEFMTQVLNRSFEIRPVTEDNPSWTPNLIRKLWKTHWSYPYI